MTTRIPAQRPRPRPRPRLRPPLRPSGARVVAGRYRLLDQVGAGGMGSVWRARDQHTGGLVAVKVLGQHSGALLARFMREQAIRLRHPHVVAPTGWAAEDDLVLLTMDLVAGGSVQDLLREQGPLPEEVVAPVLEQTLLALGAVHGAGLVHRDVKPANLLLEPGPLHLRLGDFGVAVDLAGERLTTSAAAIGTEGYMSPDQAAGASPDPRQDLYAVGVLGVHLLTGRPPEARTPLGSSRLRPLLERLLADDPDARPADAGAALVLLRRLVTPAGPGVVVPDRLGPAPDDRWRRAALPSRATVAALALLGVSASVTAACAVAVARMLG